MVISSTKISDSLYLNSIEVVVDKKKTAPSGVNHIFIYDRSGSMYGSLNALCEDLKARFRTLGKEDTLTLGWFSGEGDFNFALKGFRITSEADRKKLDKVVDDNSTVRGTTCFSEVLADTTQVIKDLSVFNNSFALTFLTDGHPVVSNYAKEVSAITKAIEAISGKITSSLLVGYGDYYNKELMASMAGKLGGSLIHSSDLSKFSFAYDEFIQGARGADKIAIDLPFGDVLGGVVFTYDTNAVIAYELTDGQAYVRKTDAGTVSVSALSSKPAPNSTKVVPDAETVYAAALTMLQRAKTDVAIELLSYIGDVGLVNKATSAFTNEEFGKAEQALVDAIKYPNRRFADGKKPGCIPDKDAFCALQIIETLMADESAEFMPFHDDFNYKKIGRGSKTKDGYPEFTPDKTSRVPLTGLVWNDSRLNLSIRAKIAGTVDLGGTDYKKLGLERVHSTYVWRNYTVVRDGVLNVQKLPVSMSKQTYDLFVKNGVVDKEHGRHYAGRVYVVHLDRVPVINRAIAEGYTSAKTLVELAARELHLKAEQKVLGFRISELEPEKPVDIVGYSPEQATFLKEKAGITASGYNPPVEKEAATDFYMAKEFELKASGFSSIPKVSEVQDRLKEKKKLTASAQLVADAIESHKKSWASLAKLKTKLEDVRGELVQVRSEIQKAKFAVVLGNKWFDEFTSRANCKLSVADVEYKFELGETKIEI